VTGKYSHINGKSTHHIKQVFDGSQQTLPKLLQKAGYQTALIGKWHLISEPTGFDYWNILPGQGTYYNPDFKTPSGDVVREEGYCTEIISDKTLDWLKNRRDKSKPFFLLSWHKAPHRTWMPEPKYFHYLDDVNVPEPDNFFDDYTGRGQAAAAQEMTIRDEINLAYDVKVTPPFAASTREEIMAASENSASRDPATLREFERMTQAQREAWDAYYVPRNERFRSLNLTGKDLTRWKYQAYIKEYLRCIASLDDNVGRLLDYLEESGLAKNTIVAYTSDQGFYLGDHGWYDKRFMYEESLRMPLLVRYPKEVKPGSVSDDIVLNLDFAATFLDYAGVPVPGDIQGESMRNVLRGKTPGNWRTSMYYHYSYFPSVHYVKRHYGVRTQRYKLIHFYYNIDEWELYDLKKDPREMKSVYHDPAYADIVTELKAELKRLREKYKDTTGAPM
jgi:arylsulfatase A-like enzyme